MGFEPTSRFLVNTLSKRAPSATRTPLRGRASQNDVRARRICDLQTPGRIATSITSWLGTSHQPRRKSAVSRMQHAKMWKVVGCLWPERGGLGMTRRTGAGAARSVAKKPVVGRLDVAAALRRHMAPSLRAGSPPQHQIDALAPPGRIRQQPPKFTLVREAGADRVASRLSAQRPVPGLQ